MEQQTLQSRRTTSGGVAPTQTQRTPDFTARGRGSSVWGSKQEQSMLFCIMRGGPYQAVGWRGNEVALGGHRQGRAGHPREAGNRRHWPEWCSQALGQEGTLSRQVSHPRRATQGIFSPLSSSPSCPLARSSGLVEIQIQRPLATTRAPAPITASSDAVSCHPTHRACAWRGCFRQGKPCTVFS